MSCGFLADERARACSATARSWASACASSRSPSRAAPPGALKLAEPMLDERFLMLNGDVLTDIDLTAQIAQHERDRRARDARAGAGRRPERLRPGDARGGPLGAGTSSRSRAPTGSTTNLISAGAYVLEREILELVPARAQRLDRARGVAAADRQRASTASPRRATGWTSAPPSATCRAPSTSSRATSHTAGARAPRRATGWRSTRTREVHGRVIPPAVLERGVRVAAGAHVGSLVVLGRGRLGRRRRSTVERAVVLDGTRDRRGLRAARLHRRRRLPRRRGHAGSPAGRCSARA